VVLVQDVTREREAERDREAVQARVVETINHEFRTPLAALIGHLELIRDRADDLPEELATSLDAIERAGWRLRDLVDAATELVEVGVKPHRR
jgi:signal transduction histidine kinase